MLLTNSKNFNDLLAKSPPICFPVPYMFILSWNLGLFLDYEFFFGFTLRLCVIFLIMRFYFIVLGIFIIKKTKIYASFAYTMAMFVL